MPENWRKRAEHYFSEDGRAIKGAEYWQDGDIERYGELCFESGHSSIYNYEAGSEELKNSYNIMRRTEGIYGERFSGAGFRGCCMALINPEYAERIEYEVIKAYSKEFPLLEGKYSVHMCESADGVTL